MFRVLSLFLVVSLSACGMEGVRYSTVPVVHKLGKSTLVLSEDVQFGMKEGDYLGFMCTPSVRKGTYPEIGWSGDVGTKCFGPVTATLTDSLGGSSFWGCHSSDFSGFVCEKENGEFFLKLDGNERLLFQDFDRIWIEN